MPRHRTSRAWSPAARFVAVGAVALTAALVTVPVASASPTWHLTKVTSTQYAEPTGVKCTAIKNCVLTSSDGYLGSTITGWSTIGWTLAHGSHVADQMAAVACPAAGHCLAVGSWGTSTTANGVIVHTANAGSTWPALHTSAVSYPYWSIWCTTASTCVAAGDRNGHTAFWSRTTNGGASWSDHTGILPSVGVISAVSCPTTTFCVAFDSTGHVARTTNAGATWSAGTVPSTAFLHFASGLWCSSSMTCFAVGSSTTAKGVILESTNGGLSWFSLAVPTGSKSLNAIWCMSTTDCVAVGRSGSTDFNGHAVIEGTVNGRSWHTIIGPTTPSSLKSVFCLSATWCTAVGTTSSGSGVVLTYS